MYLSPKTCTQRTQKIVWNLYNVGPGSKTLGRRVTSVSTLLLHSPWGLMGSLCVFPVMCRLVRPFFHKSLSSFFNHVDWQSYTSRFKVNLFSRGYLQNLNFSTINISVYGNGSLDVTARIYEKRQRGCCKIPPIRISLWYPNILTSKDGPRTERFRTI